MRFSLWLLVLISFSTGIVTSNAFSDNVQMPRSPLHITSGAEKASPQDWISQSEIHVYSDRVELDIQNAQWAVFTNTNSMDPVLDEGSHGIQLIPQSPQDLEIGDVVTYDLRGQKIIHRIVDIQQDSAGYLYTLKGDNNQAPDATPVRFEQIERVLVAVIY